MINFFFNVITQNTNWSFGSSIARLTTYFSVPCASFAFDKRLMSSEIATFHFYFILSLLFTISGYYPLPHLPLVYSPNYPLKWYYISILVTVCPLFNNPSMRCFENLHLGDLKKVSLVSRNRFPGKDS